MAELSITELPEALGANPVPVAPVTLVLDPLLGEVNGVITSVVADRVDSGIGVDYTGDTFTLTGSYDEQFTHAIKWSETQPPSHPPPIQHDELVWDDVPLLGATEFGFLIAYFPPDTMTWVVTYTVEGNYDIEDLLVPTNPPVNTPFTGTVTQTVVYDIETNVSEFKKRIP
jgi:hypothetical protein